MDGVGYANVYDQCVSTCLLYVYANCKMIFESAISSLKSTYETKCTLLDQIVNFVTQIVKIFLYRNVDGSKLVRPVFSRHLGF